MEVQHLDLATSHWLIQASDEDNLPTTIANYCLYFNIPFDRDHWADKIAKEKDVYHSIDGFCAYVLKHFENDLKASCACVKLAISKGGQITRPMKRFLCKGKGQGTDPVSIDVDLFRFRK